MRASWVSSAYNSEIAGVLVGWCLVVACTKLTRSKYSPRFGRVLARSSIRSDATPSASPGGRASAFCEPVSTKSSPHGSVSTGEPASEVTASTSRSTSSNSRTTAARAATSCNTPVDVSE